MGALPAPAGTAAREIDVVAKTQGEVMPVARSLSLYFSAGALGGLANSVVVWAVGHLGLAHVASAPALTPGWLYPRIVWGGLWGALFLLPVSWGWFRKGLLLSLGPSLVQLFLVFPLKTKAGVLGLALGLLTPLAVLFFNAVWGVVASFWLTVVRA
jgi:hypothetical protein